MANSFPTDPQPAQKTAHSDWSYEQTVSEVEAIIHRIEMGDLDLATVFDEFAIAVQHLRQCEVFLSQQKQKMDLLVETLTDEPEAF